MVRAHLTIFFFKQPCILLIIRLKHDNPSSHYFFFFWVYWSFLDFFAGFIRGHALSISCRNQSPLHHSPTMWFCQMSELTTFEHVKGQAKDAATKTQGHVHFTNQMAPKKGSQQSALAISSNIWEIKNSLPN